MIEGAMRSFPILALTLVAVVLIGMYALPHLKKNEFPDVTIRQGVVAVVYPGATAEEIEEQVASKVEDYLFTFNEVDKTKTYSYSKNGMLYVFVTMVCSRIWLTTSSPRTQTALAKNTLQSLPA